MAKELVAYMAGFGNFNGIVDPATGQVMMKVANGINESMPDTDDAEMVAVFEADGIAIFVDTSPTAYQVNLRTGAVIKSASLTFKATWINTISTGYFVLRRTISALSSSKLVFLATDSNDGGKTNVLVYDFDIDDGFVAGEFGPGTGMVVALNEGFLHNSKLYASWFDGVNYNIRSVAFNTSFMVDGVASDDYTHGTNSIGVFQYDNDSTFVVVDDVASEFLFIDATSFLSLGTPVSTATVVGGEQHSVNYFNNNGRFQLSNGRIWIPAFNTVTTGYAMLGYLRTDPSDVTAVVMTQPDFSNFITNARPDLTNGVRLSTGEFVGCWEGFVQVHDVAGALVRTLPSSEAYPDDATTKVIQLVSLDTYEVSGTTDPDGVTIKVFDDATGAELGATVSSGGTFSFEVLGSTDVRLVAESPTPGVNHQISGEVEVTLVV